MTKVALTTLLVSGTLGVAAAAPAETPTFTRDVASIIYRNCAGCHRPARCDNSLANKWNPDATKDVRWGQQTWQEMQYTGITFFVDKPASAESQNASNK